MATEKPEFEYQIFRNFIAKDKKGHVLILRPGDVVKCTELDAMCMNTIQPMTIRKSEATK